MSDLKALSLLPKVMAAAEAIFATRNRADSGLIRLQDAPPWLYEEYVAEARAAVDAIEAVPPPVRNSGALRTTDASLLGLTIGAGTLCILARDKAGRASAVLWALSAEAAELAHDEAHQLWLAVTAVIRTLPDEAAPSQPAEHTP